MKHYLEICTSKYYEVIDNKNVYVPDKKKKKQTMNELDLNVCYQKIYRVNYSNSFLSKFVSQELCITTRH